MEATGRRLMRRSRIATAACVGAAFALVTSACSLGERTKYAEMLVESPKRAERAGTAVGTMTFQLSAKPIVSGEGGGGAPGAGAGAAGALLSGGGSGLTPPPGEVPIVVDFGQRRASMSAARDGGPPEPVIVLDGTKVYVRRGTTSGISSRRWVVLDLGDIEEVNRPDGADMAERTGLLLVAFPGPLHLIELLAVSLTGITERSVPNTFTANLSREKADRELRLKDEAIQDRINTLRLVAYFDEVHPATVTLDDEGRPTDVDVSLHQNLRRDLDVRIRVTTKLTYQPATVEIPAPEDTLVIETEGQLLGELVGLTRALAGAPSEEGAP